MMIRNPAVAGSFYPADRGSLQTMIAGFLEKAEAPSLPGRLRGLVVPHAGYIYSGIVAACGYRLLKKQSEKISKVILIGPSHYVAFDGACQSGFQMWETPLGRVKVTEIEDEGLPEYPEAHVPEHCLEVQLPFLQSVLKDFETIPVLCGEALPKELAELFLRYINGRTVFIASSDLSHYLPYEKAAAVDKLANEAVPALDVRRFEHYGDACGKTAILALMHMAKKLGWKGAFVSYKNSGDTAGPKTRVVGYGCYAFFS